MHIVFQKPIDLGFSLVYIDDILQLSHTKTHMIELLEQLHQYCQKTILKSFHVLLTVKFLGLEFGNQTIKPIHSKMDGTTNVKLPLPNVNYCVSLVQ